MSPFVEVFVSSALGAHVVPLYQHDVFVSRLAGSPASLPQPLIELFLAHRRGKPWNEIGVCTNCKRKITTALAVQIGGKCGYCRSGRIVEFWDQRKVQDVLTKSMVKTDGSGLTVALGHVESPSPVVIGFVQVSVVTFKDLTSHLDQHDVLNEVGTHLGRKECYTVIDNLAVLSPEHDDTTILKLLDSVIRDRHSILTLVGKSTLYEACLAQRDFRLCKNLPDRVAFMARV